MEESQMGIEIRIQPETDSGERRGAMRFPIEQEVRFRICNRNSIEAGTGRTVNMSSSGVLFVTERRLILGERLELSVNWPAQLNKKCALKLVTTGRVVRIVDGLAAIAIDRYEFRTQGIHGLKTSHAELSARYA
jgi:hypothetical protein